MSEDKKIFEQTYDLPEAKESLVDIHKGEVVEAKDVAPIDVIKAVAKKHKWDIKDPSPGCKKCYGRGYAGKNMDGSPIPCKCLFRGKTSEQKKKESQQPSRIEQLNRGERRNLQKLIHKRFQGAKKKNPNLIDEIIEEVKAESVTENVDFSAINDPISGSDYTSEQLQLVKNGAISAGDISPDAEEAKEDTSNQKD